MSAPAIIGHVEPFRVGTDDWEQYEERMAQFLSVNEIEGNRKVAVFLTMVGPQAYALLSNLLARGQFLFWAHFRLRLKTFSNFELSNF